VLLYEPQLRPPLPLSGGDALASGSRYGASGATTSATKTFEYAEGFAEVISRSLGFLQLFP